MPNVINPPIPYELMQTYTNPQQALPYETLLPFTNPQQAVPYETMLPQTNPQQAVPYELMEPIRNGGTQATPSPPPQDEIEYLWQNYYSKDKSPGSLLPVPYPTEKGGMAPRSSAQAPGVSITGRSGPGGKISAVGAAGVGEESGSPAGAVAGGKGSFELTQGELPEQKPYPSISPGEEFGPPAPPAVPHLGAALAPSSAQQGAPKSEQELQQRMVGWKAFGERAKTDPMLAMMLFYMGAQIMQPRYGGQTLMGRAGEAGVNALNFMNATQGERYKAGQQEQQMGLEERRVASGEQHTNAQIDQIKATTQHLQTETRYMPDEIRSRIDGQVAHANYLVQQGKLSEAHAELIRAEAQLQGNTDYQKAKINELNAQAEHYRMAARASGSTTHERDAEAFSRIKQNDRNWHPEITDPALRKAEADQEAWHEVLPGGIADLQRGITAEGLIDAGEQAYQEALAKGGKPGEDAKKLGHDAWVRQYIQEEGIMSGGGPEIRRALGLLGKPRAGVPTGPSGATGGAAPGGTQRPSGVPAEAQLGVLKDGRRVWAWPDPAKKGNMIIVPAQ